MAGDHGSDVSYFGRAERPGGPIIMHRRVFRPGLLAVVATGVSATVIALAATVSAANMAAAQRHVDESHAVTLGVAICRAPCPGALALLPSAEEADCHPSITSSA